MMAALIKDPVFLLACLAGVVGLVFQVSRLPRLQGLYAELASPPAVRPLCSLIGTCTGLFVAQVLAGLTA